jgi:hypothetical protein
MSSSRRQGIINNHLAFSLLAPLRSSQISTSLRKREEIQLLPAWYGFGIALVLFKSTLRKGDRLWH